ncbi:MAG: hypothetical protein NEA02_18810 [Thermoanaerobaculia bacterium]|nr:hypothetical protein [Thermoanaerobaculia bacterium]
MTRRPLIPLAFVAAALLSGLAARAADQPKAAATDAQRVPALSAAHLAKLNRLKALPQADPQLTLVAGLGKVPLKPTAVKKEISCGIYLYPPNPYPNAVSPLLFFVNTTGQPLPTGVHIDWQVEGAPASCCKGVGHTTIPWQPNPPTPAFLKSTPMVFPPQPWTRECRAWVTMP